MVLLNDRAMKELQNKLEDEKIIFWEDVTNIYLNKKKVFFLYNNLNSLSIHVKIMKEDGWLYDETQNNVTTFINKKNKQEVPFFIAEFRKTL